MPKAFTNFGRRRLPLASTLLSTCCPKMFLKEIKMTSRGPFKYKWLHFMGWGVRVKTKNGNANFLAALQFTPLSNKTILLKNLPNVQLGFVSTVLCVLGKLLGSWFVGKLFLKHCNQSRLSASDVPQPSRRTTSVQSRNYWSGSDQPYTQIARWWPPGVCTI